MSQFILILSIFIVGFSFLPLLFGGLKFTVRNYISPFVGLGLISLSVGALIAIGSPVTLSKVTGILIVIWIIIYIYLVFKNVIELRGCKSFSYKLFSNLNMSIIIFLLYSIIAFFFVALGKSSTVSDSTQFEGIGRFLANGGTLNDQPPLIPFLLNGRLLVVGAMHCLSRLFGSYNLYALNPTLLIWFVGLCLLLFYYLIEEFSKKRKIFLLGGLALTIIINKGFNYQILHIHSNGLSMVYCSIPILSLYLYLKSQNEDWITFGTFALGVGTLIRVDMLIFSLIYFALIFKVAFFHRELIKNAWIIFIIIALPWRLFSLSMTPFNSWYVNSYQILILLISHGILALVTIYCSKKIISKIHNVPLIAIISCFVFFILLLFVSPKSVGYAWQHFMIDQLLSQQWIFLFLSILVMLSSLPLMRQIDEHLVIFPYSIILYLIQLFLVVTIAGFMGQDHVAGRNVFHIIPLFIFWVFISFSRFLGQSSKSSLNIQ